MVSSWTYALVFVCSQYATKTIAKEFNKKKKKKKKKKQGRRKGIILQGQKTRERTKATKGNRWASGVLAHKENWSLSLQKKTKKVFPFTHQNTWKIQESVAPSTFGNVKEGEAEKLEDLLCLCLRST